MVWIYRGASEYLENHNDVPGHGSKPLRIFLVEESPTEQEAAGERAIEQGSP